MKIDLVFVSGRTLDTEPSFFFQFDDGNLYVFNVPDGTQRLYMQHKWKLGRIRQFFFTSNSHDALGGIVGGILTANGSEIPPFGMTCSEAAQDVISNTLTYRTYPDTLPVPSRSFADSNLQVEMIPMSSSVCFVVHLKEHPGKFMLQKAAELGIPKGPMFKDLVNGKSVTLEDGRVIRPEDCVGPATPGDKILVVDCRSASDFEKIREIDQSNIQFVIHVTKPQILETEEYKALFTFDRKVSHICFMPSGRISYGPVLSMYQKVTGNTLCSFGDTPAPEGFKNAYTGLSYAFAPLGKQKFSDIVKPEQTSSVCPDIPLPKFSDFAVTFLGTGAKMPSKLRNPAAILVHIKSGFILLDAGEDTLGQLRRRYGMKNTEYILQNLKLIWISHHHGDHLFGAPQIVEERAKVCNDVIPFCCDQPILEEMIIREKYFGDGYFKLRYINREQPVIAGDGFELTSIPVSHCDGSQGCLLVADGHRIAYSGDRRMQDGFVESVKSCDLLIHEATFSDDLAEKAEEFGHATISQAVDVGNRLSAKYIILTHISNRYSGTQFTSEARNVLYAFDYLEVVYDQMEKVCDLYRTAFDAIQNEDAEL